MQPVAYCPWICRYYLLASLVRKPCHASIISLALSLSFAVMAASYSDVWMSGAAGGMLNGWCWLYGVWSWNKNMEMACRCLWPAWWWRKEWGWASREKRTLSLGISFCANRDFCWVPWQQWKAVNEVQSSPLPKHSHCAPCQNLALASCAGVHYTGSTQTSSGLKKRNYDKITPCPTAQRRQERNLIPWKLQGAQCHY